MLKYDMKNKKLLVLSGISGVGKSSAIKILLDKHDFHFSVSTTSRAPREKEVHGVDYHFVSKQEFECMVRDDKFIEHIGFLDYSYGTTYDSVANNIYEQIILDLDHKGYQALKIRNSNVFGIFLHHDDMNEIMRRLIDRSGVSAVTPEIQSRLDKALISANTRHEYDHIINVTNLTVDETVNQILLAFYQWFNLEK